MNTVDQRLKFARETSGLTLKQVREQTGLGASSLCEWENGTREPSFSQLNQLARLYRRTTDFFFQPGPPPRDIVLWRERPDGNQSGEIERKLLQLAEQYQRLEFLCGNPEVFALPFEVGEPGSFSYSKAESLAHRFRKAHGLGDRPGSILRHVLQDVCRIKLFHLPFSPSGTAACTWNERVGAAILLNSNNVLWRRNFDLAHELFHLLTWRVFRIGENEMESSELEEKYANCFASSLLMPADVLREAIDKQRDQKSVLDFDDLFEVARQFDVSVPALVWQLVSLKLITKEGADQVLESIHGRVNYWEKRTSDHPETRPLRFQALAREAIEKGLISTGKFAEYLGISRQAAMKIVEEEIHPGMEREGNAQVEITHS